MRQDGSHFFTTSYPPCKPLSLSLAFCTSLSETIVTFCSLILPTSLSPQMSLSFHLSVFPPPYEVHLPLHYMVSAVLWSLHLQSKHRGLCCFPCCADGSEMTAAMLLFSPQFWEPLSQPLNALFDADRKHSKREKLPDRDAKYAFLPPISWGMLLFSFGYECFIPFD